MQNSKSTLNKGLNYKFKDVDKNILLIIIPIILATLGLIFIYSASFYTAKMTFGDQFYFLKKQSYAFIVGIVVMFAMLYLNIDKLAKYSIPILIFSLLILGLVFIPGIGVENYGARRWLNLGLFTIQPSEIAKFGLVIFVASYMAKNDMTKMLNILIVLIAGGIMCVEIMLEPNMSITMCVGLTLICLLIIGGIPIKKLVLICIPLIIIAILLIVLEPYRMSRMMAYINPWADEKGEGYQLIQSYYALGSGGFFGVGLFNSRQKFMFLPFAESDFIFAIIGEETGFFGCLLIILLFLILIYAGFRVARNAKTRLHCYLASGITLILAFQSVLNIAVVCGAIPPTGLPLPFISAGGSSLVCYMGACGILYNIALKSKITHKT